MARGDDVAMADHYAAAAVHTVRLRRERERVIPTGETAGGGD